MVLPRPPRPPITPTPPGSYQEVQLLRVLLDDVAEPQVFTDEALVLMLTLTQNMYRAAALGWRWKAVKVADPNRLVRGTIGNETLEFPSLSDLAAWLDRQKRFFDDLADLELFPLFGESSAIWLKTQDVSFFGVSGPYSSTHPHGPGAEGCYDATRGMLSSLHTR